MQFTDSTNKTGLYEDAQFLTGTDTNAFPIAQFTRLANRWYYKAVMAAWNANDDWRFDDSNQTNFAIATTTLVASQQDYSIPTNALRVYRIEVKDSAGNYQKLAPIDDGQINVALSEFEETAGMPRFYRLEKNSVLLYPAPAAASVTTASGLKIYFDREVDEFTTADTTQEPGIAEPFHRILSLGAAYDFAVAKGLANVNLLRQEVEMLLRDLSTYYSSRHLKGSRPRLTPARMASYT